jgi:hypothetical protein
VYGSKKPYGAGSRDSLYHIIVVNIKNNWVTTKCWHNGTNIREELSKEIIDHHYLELVWYIKRILKDHVLSQQLTSVCF